MIRSEHQTLNERAYTAIKRGLVSGSFAPGQALRIRKLADQYGISDHAGT
jgi:DNA-binding GntR family transcriptional regulator